MVSGEILPEDRLIRFVAAPDGVLVPDLAACLPGRGTWVSADRDSLTQAAARRLFSRSQKAQIQVPDSLVDQVESLLVRDCLNGLGLARKSGALVCGFEKVTARLRAGEAHLLIEARDGAEDGRTKVLALAAKACPGIGLVAAFTSQDLGLALGLDNVVHATLMNERFAARLARDVGRLSGFRSVVPEDWVLPQGLKPPVPGGPGVA